MGPGYMLCQSTPLFRHGSAWSTLSRLALSDSSAGWSSLATHTASQPTPE